MKQRFNNARSFILGMLTMLLLVSLAFPALAATVTKSIEVRSGIRVFIDDKELIPKDGNGNQVEVFLYNGTTYLPVRAISEVFGTPIQWDGSAQSVYIGRHTSSTPAVYLSQLDYFNKSSTWFFDEISKDNLGNEHLHSFRNPSNSTYGISNGSVIYKLNGQYSRLTGLYYQEYTARAYDGKPTIMVISGDGRELWRGSVASGVDTVAFDIDISGVLELTLEYPSSGNGSASRTRISEVALWT